MARLKNSELAAQLEAAHVSYETLVTERDSLLTDIAELRAQLAAPKTATPSLRPGQRLAYVSDRQPSAEQLHRRAAMAAAREAAMQTGRSALAF